MKSPERFRALPSYMLSMRKVVSSKAGELYAPEATRLDIDDVFSGDSLCILDYIMDAFDGSFDEPDHMRIVVRKVSRVTSDGWLCDYDKNACEPFSMSGSFPFP